MFDPKNLKITEIIHNVSNDSFTVKFNNGMYGEIYKRDVLKYSEEELRKKLLFEGQLRLTYKNIRESN